MCVLHKLIELISAELTYSECLLVVPDTKRNMADPATASTFQQTASGSTSTSAALAPTAGINANAENGNGNPSSQSAGPGGIAGRSAMDNPPDMHLDTQTGKWMFEDPQTGQEFEWNEAANAWLPVVEDDLIKLQQAAYSVKGVDETVSPEYRILCVSGSLELNRNAFTGTYERSAYS